jgi:hypothetical protein
MTRDASGVPLFDEDMVMRLFGSRSAPATQVSGSLGIVGSATLGLVAEPKPSLRELRRREIWRQRRAGEPGQAPRMERYRTG